MSENPYKSPEAEEEIPKAIGRSTRKPSFLPWQLLIVPGLFFAVLGFLTEAATVLTVGAAIFFSGVVAAVALMRRR